MLSRKTLLSNVVAFVSVLVIVLAYPVLKLLTKLNWIQFVVDRD